MPLHRSESNRPTVGGLTMTTRSLNGKRSMKRTVVVAIAESHAHATLIAAVGYAARTAWNPRLFRCVNEAPGRTGV